jgi:hypothetical protein
MNVLSEAAAILGKEGGKSRSAKKCASNKAIALKVWAARRAGQMPMPDHSGRKSRKEK